MTETKCTVHFKTGNWHVQHIMQAPSDKINICRRSGDCIDTHALTILNIRNLHTNIYCKQSWQVYNASSWKLGHGGGQPQTGSAAHTEFCPADKKGILSVASMTPFGPTACAMHSPVPSWGGRRGAIFRQGVRGVPEI
jgi:hypothetical protein